MTAGGTAQDDPGVDLFEPSFSALVVDDDPGVRQSLRLCLEAERARVLGVGSIEAALDALERTHFDVVLLDIWLGDRSGMDALPEILRRSPGSGVIVITAFATFESAVEAMRRGATDYLPKPFTPDQVRLATRRFLESSSLRRRVAELEERLEEGESEVVFSSTSPSFRTCLQSSARAAASDCVILLRGESGTGKNVLARWIRAHSPRANAAFVTVNCPDLSSDLMSSVLFGHRRGAFTGAVSDVQGKVQEAEGGTLFLDEVGDLNAEAQARLLRFLNDRTYERLGEAKERQANVRLITSTNRSLEEDVHGGRFREDLLHRLKVVTLTLPPLRERVPDIVPLARHYLDVFSRRQRRGATQLSPSAQRAIEAYHWPGNLRELRNAVERAVILGASTVIEPVDLGLLEIERATPPGVALGSPVTLDELEREHIARVVLHSPTLEAAARVLGIDATTLQRKRKRYGLV
jgi:two-component system, NtrC family, response regulator AlgB